MNVAFIGMILLSAKTTILISMSAMVLGLGFALVGALCEIASTPCKHIAFIWQGLIRGLPDILIIFMCNFGLQALFAWAWPDHSLSPFLPGLLSLSVIVGAYGSPIIVSSYLAIPKSSMKAAKVLHLSKATTRVKIIAPQLVQHALPATMNLWLVVLKDSSIVSLIGLNDMMQAAHIASSESFEPFSYYAFTGLIYLLLSWLSSFCKSYIEKKLSQGAKHAIAYT